MSEALVIDTIVEAPQFDIADIDWNNVENYNMLEAAPAAKEVIEVSDVPKEEVNAEKEVIEPPKEVESKETLNSDDQEVSVKIDGKEEKVSLKELKANYSGKVAYDRKFSEVDKLSKESAKKSAALQQEINTVNEYVNTFASKMKNNDAVGAMSYLAEFSGMSPSAMKQALIAQLMPEINRQSGLTDSERDLEITREEMEFQKTVTKRDLEKLKQENSRNNSELANARLRAEKGVSDNEWEEAFSFLDTHIEAGKPITRTDVVDYAIWKRADNKASNALTEYDGGKYLKDNNTRDTLTKIVRENPDFTASDLQDVLKEAFRGKAEETLKKVIEVKNVQNKPRDDKGKFTYTTQPLTDWDL